MIYIASDHAGFTLKQALITYLQSNGLAVEDCGAYSEDSVDYPDFAKKLAHKMQEGAEDRGILICGSGVGISIAANRFAHIRAAICYNEEIAKLSREHNDANVLVLGSRFVSEEQAIKWLEIFLTTPFAGGRHTARVAKL